MIAGLVSAFFPAGLLASEVADGIGGALLGRLRDTGLKDEAIGEIAARIGLGKAAILVLTAQNDVPDVERLLKGYEPPVVVHPLIDSTLAQFHQATGDEDSPSS